MSKHDKNKNKENSKTLSESLDEFEKATSELTESLDKIPPPVEKPTLGTLFGAYKESTANVEAAQHALTEAEVAQSAAIKAIHDNYGVGPFRVGERKMKIRKRKDTFYFTSEGEETVIDV